MLSEELNVNIRKVNILCDEGIFNGKFELRVHDKDDVKTIIDKLQKVNGLQSAVQTV